MKFKFKLRNPFNLLREYCTKRLKAKIEKKLVIIHNNNTLQELIDEYRLIMKKESTLPLAKRKEVIEEVEKYMESGHIIQK